VVLPHGVASLEHVGIQPICPSEYASFNFGNSINFPENSQSPIDANELLNESATPTAGGESGPAADSTTTTRRACTRHTRVVAHPPQRIQ